MDKSGKFLRSNGKSVCVPYIIKTYSGSIHNINDAARVIQMTKHEASLCRGQDCKFAHLDREAAEQVTKDDLITTYTNVREIRGKPARPKDTTGTPAGSKETPV